MLVNLPDGWGRPQFWHFDDLRRRRRLKYTIVQIRLKQGPEHLGHAALRHVRGRVPDMLLVHMVDHQPNDRIVFIRVTV